MERLVRNFGNFLRFLEAAGISHGAVLNISNLAQECRVVCKVVEGYIGLLKDLMLAHRVPVFVRRAQMAQAAHPKFFFYDVGLYRLLRPVGIMDLSKEINGRALDGLVYQHLFVWNSYRGAKHGLHYWRTSSDIEVDFAVYGDGVFWVVEFKDGRRTDDKDLAPSEHSGKISHDAGHSCSTGGGSS